MRPAPVPTRIAGFGFAVLALLLLTGAPAWASDPNAMVREIKAVKLDSQKLKACEKATAALAKLDKATLAKANDEVGNGSSFEEWERAASKYPAYVAAIHRGFKNIREYFAVSFAFNQAQQAVAMKRQGAPAREWRDLTSKRNLAFVASHFARVKKMEAAVADRLNAQ